MLTPIPPAETTSVLATAMVGPTFGFGGPRVDEWEQRTVEEVRQHADAPGVHVCRGLFAARMPDMIPPTAELLPLLGPIFRRYATERLPQESFGDFVIRAGYVTPTYTAHDFHEQAKVTKAENI